MTNYTEKLITAIALDPIYIGTGGYTIGKVDNTIVRDPITNVPKIPGSSLAGTWRYYVALKLVDEKNKAGLNNIKEILQKLREGLNENYKNNYKTLEEKIKEHLNAEPNLKNNLDKIEENWIKKYVGNLLANIKCAGQDDASNASIYNPFDNKEAGHCGHCIVCHSFGFSKKDLSYQGRLFFSDLNIFAFPVNTFGGIYWVINPEYVKKEILQEVQNDEEIKIKIKGSDKINLGYLYFQGNEETKDLKEILKDDYKNIVNNVNNIDNGIKDSLENYFIVVSQELFSQIVNSNLETRTSVSIDPITGAAKEGALFTSEAISRLTIFVGSVRFKNPIEYDKIAPNLTEDLVFQMLDDTKDLFEIFGIGGMTTRGFGRLKINSLNNE